MNGILDHAQNLAKTVGWRIQRTIVDRIGASYPYLGLGERRVLFITHSHRISASQIFPFFFYQGQLRERFDVELREISLEAFENGWSPWVHRADLVCLQTWFDIEPDRMSRLLDRIRRLCSPARLVFLDSFAPTDLRLAESLDLHVDLYVKKHVFKDRTRYGKLTIGDTNLMEYYVQRYGLQYGEVHYPVPAGFLDKLIVGPSFFTADYMMPRFLAGTPMSTQKDIDVHARLGLKGSDWYSAMRKEAVESIESLNDLRVIGRLGVNKRQYMSELSRSKICFSPFGYGEIAWRDYEAVLCGALLLKPDMSHMETDPNVFVANETYVPLAWDFSDVEQKVRYYLTNKDERQRIAACAFDCLHQYLRAGAFVKRMERVFADKQLASLPHVSEPTSR